MVDDFVVLVWIAVVQGGRRGWRRRRIRRIAYQAASVGVRRTAGAGDVVPVVAVHAVSAQRLQPHCVGNGVDFVDPKAVQTARRKRCRSIFLWLAYLVGESRPTDLHDVDGEEDDQHQHNDDNHEDLLVRPRRDSPNVRYRRAVFIGLVRTVCAVIPLIAQQALWNTDVVADALEVARIAAHRFVAAIGTICRSIAHETLVNALARVATGKKI